MSKTPKVSIVAPAFNGANCIEVFIDSILNQTYTNWEMLVIDDCSTDSSLKILKELSEKDNRVKILLNKQNSGAAVSRNYGLREAKGKWIAFLDSDDLWKPDKLEKQLCFMTENDYSGSYTLSINVDEFGNTIGTYETGPCKVGYKKLLLFKVKNMKVFKA